MGQPFRKLKIDEFECAVLKTVLLLKRKPLILTSELQNLLITLSIPASFTQRAIYSGQEGGIASIHTKCMNELMEHCESRDPAHGAERFGEILLLISSIRCGVKSLYNQTRVSDVFNLMDFDPFVRDILLN